MVSHSKNHFDRSKTLDMDSTANLSLSSSQPHSTETDLPTVLDPTTCSRRGFCPITHSTQDYKSGNLRQIYYELHGDQNATHKMVFVMGLNNTCFSWARQVDYFGKKPNHAVLVFDNRGVGYSTAGSFELYKTSEMAKDALDLLNYLHWDQDRSIHLIGVSMGGMIIQELCFLIPNRIISIVFASTKARDLHIPPLSVIYKIAISGFPGATQADRVSALVDILFPKHYLDQPTDQDEMMTYRQLEEAKIGFQHRVMRPQTPFAMFSATLAALFHSCSPDALSRLGKMLGSAKVMILAGDEDIIMDWSKSLDLHQALPGSELVVWPGGGHALCAQMAKEHNLLIERVMKEGYRAMADAGLSTPN